MSTQCARLPTSRSVLLLAASLALCLVPGCHELVSQGDQSTYRFAWWLGPAVIVAGLLGIPLGWVLRKWNVKLGFALMVLGPVLLVVVAPAMYNDRVVVDNEHFEARYGFWFAPTVHNLRFRDLREIRYVAVPADNGRTNNELHCLTAAGELRVVHAGNLVVKCVPEIMERARAAGIPVVNQVP